MFSSFLNPGGQSRSRSKSPGRRAEPESDEESKYRRRSKRSESDSDASDRGQARYEERTPDAYPSRSSKDDRRRSKQPNQDSELSRKSSSKRAEQDRGRRERDPYGYAETPQSAKPNGNAYGDRDYASYTGHAEPPGAFPGQSSNRQYEPPGNFQYANPAVGDYQYNYAAPTNGRQPTYSQAYGNAGANAASHPQRPNASIHQRAYSEQSAPFAEPTHGGSYRDSDSDRTRARRQSYNRERSPNPGTEQLRKSLGRLSTGGMGSGSLSVATPHTAGAGGRPPASPLLEAYTGTYQTISPLPSPLALAKIRDDDFSDFALSGSDASDDETSHQIRELQRRKAQLKLETQDTVSPRSSLARIGGSSKKSRANSSVGAKNGNRRSVSFYDPSPDAERIADALKGSHRSPDPKPLLKIMPWLSADEIILLKTEYKNHAKVGGQGINLSKHIKTRIFGNLGKILYATSLGQYESDAYWANCFYQSGASRRELLIESLIGRSNQQVREIKDAFRDKKYDDDLEKCMKAELKADKFRMAVLLALEERRQPEGLGIDMRKVHEDGMDLYQALHGAAGQSESAMIKIILLRADDHLREVLRYYEKSYRRNFAREMLSRSQNLVGETLAHMLNGALNRPMRDAILLHQAIDEFDLNASSAHPSRTQASAKPNTGRAELLISRVVRMHWDPRHMERVKREYQERYGESVVRAIARDVQGGMKTDEGRAWSGFVMDLLRSSER